MILTQDSCIGRLVLSGHNDMGRWCYHTYSCKNFRQLTIASVYQPCNQRVLDRGHVRTLTFTAQHTSLLRQQGRHETPRQAFIMDLRQFITDQHAQGNGVLLAGDYNEELDVMYDGITKLCSDFHLVDLMFHLTGRDDFATYARGSKRIDYILCDAWVSDASIQGAMNLFNITSKGIILLWLSTSTPIFYLEILPPHSQHQPSKNFHPKMLVLTGNTYKQSTNTSPNITSHHVLLTYKKRDPDLAEQLDRDFQRASSSATKSVRRKPTAPYITKLANLRKEKNVLKQILSQHRTGIDLSSSIAHQVRDGHNFLVPETIPECQQRCREAQQEI